MSPSPDGLRAAPAQQLPAATLPTRELFELVYRELHALAQRHLRRERCDHTLQPTALVHEVYLRFARQRQDRWQSRGQFVAVASQMIRRVLVNHAKARGADRRGGDRRRVSFEEAPGADASGTAQSAWVAPTGTPARGLDLLALDEALEKLERLDARQGRIVELRFFGGLEIDEIAKVVGVSPRTVDGEWALARAWLRAELRRGSAG